MSQPRKPILSELMGAFFMLKFIVFARTWPNKQDFDNLNIKFAPNGYPIAFTERLIAVMIKAGAYPEQFSPDLIDYDTTVFLRAFSRSPDLVIAFVQLVREEIKNAGKYRKQLMFGGDQPEKLSEAEKQERRKRRKDSEAIIQLKDEAQAYHKSVLQKNLEADAWWRPNDKPKVFRFSVPRTAKKMNKVTRRVKRLPLKILRKR